MKPEKELLKAITELKDEVKKLRETISMLFDFALEKYEEEELPFLDAKKSDKDKFSIYY
jgi:hypothetical protein